MALHVCKGYSPRGIRSRGKRLRGLINGRLSFDRKGYGGAFQRQEIKFPRPIHITSPSFGLKASAEVKVSALRTADRAAGILIQNETSKGLPTDKLACGIEYRPFCNDEGERASGKQPRISGDGSAGCKWNFKIHQRAFLYEV